LPAYSFAVSRLLRIGLLGAGRIAPPALVTPARRRSDVSVAAIAAREVERARVFAREHGVVLVVSDYEALVCSPEIDAVYIGLPASLHCAWTVRALAAKKHVLCEKPFASNAGEAARMVGAAERADRVLVEAFHYRYHPLFAEVLAACERGDVGRIVEIEGRFDVGIDPGDIRHQLALGGGATMDLGCYPIHWMRTIAGEEPRVRSARATVDLAGIDAAMTAELEFPSGIVGQMGCSMVVGTPFVASLVVRGTDGVLEVDNPLHPHRGHRLRLIRAGVPPLERTVEGLSTYDHQLEAFVDAITARRAPLTGGSDAIANMHVIDSVYESAGLAPRGQG
jgi:predicted dehydrogenase